MLHAVVISLFLVIAMRDTEGVFSHDPGAVPRWASTLLVILPMLVLGGLGSLVSWRTHRQLSRHGRSRALRLHHRCMVAVQIGVALWHAAAVLALGWAGTVRSITGNLVVVDELLIIAPAMLTLASLWWSSYPIERLLHEQSLIPELDSSKPVYRMPGRWENLWMHVRHQVLLIALPITALFAWHETIARLPDAWFPTWDRAVLTTSLQVLGVVLVILAAPVAIRHLWDLEKLPRGAVRDRLERLCAASRIRARGLLLWNTHGTLANAAVLGPVYPFRYIMLSDALLESLDAEQVEAVMAHEVAHAKLHHLPWLGASVLVPILLITLASDLALHSVPSGAVYNIANWASVVVMLAAAVLVFGWVSRRFELQADAFAVRWLASSHADETRPGTVQPEHAGAMASALAHVAKLNHLPVKKFTWRHGSIATRIDRIGSLVGRGLDHRRWPINRQVLWIKLGSLLGLLLVAGVAWFGGAFGSGAEAMP